MKYVLAICATLFSAQIVAQSALEYSVLVQAEALENPPRIVLSWNADANATSYTVARKLSTSSIWETLESGISSNSFQDDSAQIGVRYDYRVIKNAGYTGFGYVRAGIQVETPANRGVVLVLAETSLAQEVEGELEMLVSDLKADGYGVVLETVADTAVTQVKQRILNAVAANEAIDMLYIIGHVPVPYSGNIAPDGHVPDHLGAWPADVYYADLDGTWSDNVINNTGATDPRNQNAIGDGKFDQSTLPGNGVELMIGRIDFSNLTHFSQDEAELTRRYLNRVHAYKNADWQLPKRALIDDNFGGFGGEAFATNGWRNFSPLIGGDSIGTGDYRTDMTSGGYLFSYGCGGGSHESAGGIGTSTQLAGDSLRTAFSMLFGSYFGDWDRQNNFLRSALAQGTTLSMAWAGRPWWYLHPMGLGQSIGECARLTQNNINTFHPNYGERFVHIALLGDPSLRMEYTAPPSHLAADTVDTFHVQLSWTASADTSIDGYHIYRQKNGDEWFRLNETPVANTQFVDSCVLDSGQYTYSVKAAALRSGFSGSYWDESLGVTAQVDILSDKNPVLISKLVEQPYKNASNIVLVSNGLNISYYIWYLEHNTIYGDGTDTAYIYPLYSGMNTYTLVYGNTCASDSASGEFYYSLGIEEAIQTRWKISPNPLDRGESRLELVTDARINGQAYEIYNVDGRLVESGMVSSRVVKLKSSYDAGVYMLKIAEFGTNRFIVK